MTQRIGNPIIHLTLVTALHSVILLIPPAQADLIAYTSFEEPDVFSATTLYQDTGDESTGHALLNNENEPFVNWTQTGPGDELGFSSFYRNTRNDEGLTDGDYVGVTSSKSGFSEFPAGNKGFKMSDTDGLMTTTLDSVTLSGFLNPMVSAHLFVVETGWEADDRIRVWATVDGGTKFDLFNTTGQDIDDLNIEKDWLTLSASLTGYTTATLAFELDSNSDKESIFIDNITFTGEVVPVPGAYLLACLGMGVASVWLKKVKRDV